MSTFRKLIYNKAYEPFVGVTTIETIDTSALTDGFLFTLDILIHTSNGQNVLENCSFVHFISTYHKSGGTVSFIDRQELRRVVVEGGALNAINLVEGVDYFETINGSGNIEIQLDGSAGYNSYVTSYIELEGVLS